MKISQLDIYTLGDGAVDRLRLDRITEIFRPSTLALLDRVGVQPGMACLDVGCGTGGVAFDLARLVGPEGRVVGLDIDDLRIQEGRRDAAALKVPNVEFRLADIRTVSEPAPEFDLVYSRLLLDNVAYPAKVLSTMYRMLKPDGKLVAECTDYSGWCAQWIVTLGIAKETEVEQVLAEVTRHIENPRTTMGTPRFVQCWGSKPKLPNDVGRRGSAG